MDIDEPFSESSRARLIESLSKGVSQWNSARSENPRITFALPEIDLSGRDLTGIDFNNAILTAADFSGTCLRNADFRQADLSRCNFSGADLSGANLQNAVLLKVIMNTPASFVGTNLAGSIIETTLLKQMNIDEEQRKSVRPFPAEYAPPTDRRMTARSMDSVANEDFPPSWYKSNDESSILRLVTAAEWLLEENKFDRAEDYLLEALQQLGLRVQNQGGWDRAATNFLMLLHRTGRLEEGKKFAEAHHLYDNPRWSVQNLFPRDV